MFANWSLQLILDSTKVLISSGPFMAPSCTKQTYKTCEEEKADMQILSIKSDNIININIPFPFQCILVLQLIHNKAAADTYPKQQLFLKP